jgi:hypothetical protein
MLYLIFMIYIIGVIVSILINFGYFQEESSRKSSVYDDLKISLIYCVYSWISVYVDCVKYKNHKLSLQYWKNMIKWG